MGLSPNSEKTVRWRIEPTDCPEGNDEALVIAQTRHYNAGFTVDDVRPLCVFARDVDDNIVVGLTAKTYWEYLEVQFLWVGESYRKQGHASSLMRAAETEARRRGRKHALLDTFSLQAIEFYEKLGYIEFGKLNGFSEKHERHFLQKDLSEPSVTG